jgi:hypothetical protein
MSGVSGKPFHPKFLPAKVIFEIIRSLAQHTDLRGFNQEKLEVTKSLGRRASTCLIQVELVRSVVSGFPLANQFCGIGIHIEARPKLGTPDGI